MKKIKHPVMLAAGLMVASTLLSFNGFSQSKKLPEGTVVYNDGSKKLPNGTVIYKDGSVKKSTTVGLPHVTKRYHSSTIHTRTRTGKRLPPGQAKKIYGGSATDYAAGQQKKITGGKKNDHRAKHGKGKNQ